MRLWTVRHPPTHSKGICVGQLSVPISIAIEKALSTVIQAAPIIPRSIWSSDLPRCQNLAAALAKFWQCPHHIDPRLREISMGEWEGKSFDELLRKDTQRWQYWCNNWISQAPPKGESMLDVEQRVQNWKDTLLLEEETLLLAHAGVVRVLRCILGEKRENAFSYPVPHLVWQEHLFS